MKRVVRILSLIVVFAITFGLFGCQAQPQPQTPTVAPTDSVVDPTESGEKTLNEQTGLVDNPVILFMGDSITDGGRTDYKDKTFLGSNHPKVVASKLTQAFPDEEFTFYSTGVSGDTVLDQCFRLKEDCFDLNPDYIVMLLGINDVWNGYKTKAIFEKTYRMLLDAMISNTDAKIILVQPYLLEASQAMQDVCVIANVNGYIPKAVEVADVVCSLAAEYDLDIIYLWEILEQQHAKGTTYQQLASDAIHPTALAANILADQIMLKLGVKDYAPTNGEFDTSEIAAKYEAQAPANPPEITDPFASNDSENAAAEYYFAVGSVDKTAKTAKVLTGDGEVLTINWDGEAPVVGNVNTFTKENDVYHVQNIDIYPAYGAAAATINLFVNSRQNSIVIGKRYFFTNETVIFVRYSATQWRVFKGKDSLCKDGTSKMYMYTESMFSGLGMAVKYAMVVGDYADVGRWPAANKATTSFLDPEGAGWNSGVIDLS